MKITDLQKIFDDNKTNELEWQGKCHDCGEEIVVLAKRDDKETTLIGGAIYNPDLDNEEDYNFFIKCESCFKKDHVLRKFRPTEVYSRVVGYMRPVNKWNGAKQSEFKMRRVFDQPKL